MDGLTSTEAKPIYQDNPYSTDLQVGTTLESYETFKVKVLKKICILQFLKRLYGATYIHLDGVLYRVESEHISETKGCFQRGSRME